MSMLTVFHLGGRWLALDGSRLVELPEHPELDLPVMVVSDFNHALTGVVSLEAKPSMAAPLIERRLRDEGMVEGETRLEISHLVRVGEGFQALYCAIPMADWQKMISWAGERSDHCLVVPLISVARRLLQPGQGVVIHHGKQVSFLAADAHAIHHADTLAYSDDEQGVRDAVNGLADRVRAQLGRSQRPSKVLWYALDPAPGHDDAALAAGFADALDLHVHLAKHQSLILETGDTVQSAMPAVAQAARVTDATTPRLAGVMQLAERVMPLAAALVAAVALGLFAFSWYGHARATSMNADASQMRAQATRLQSQADAQQSQLKQDARQLTDTRQFVERMVAAARSPDTSVALANIRQAARTWVRILRVRVDEADHRLYVEGAIDPGREGADHLGLFIANLRAAGFEPIAVDAPLGARTANYFAYALDPAKPVSVEDAP